MRKTLFITALWGYRLAIGVVLCILVYYLGMPLLYTIDRFASEASLGWKVFVYGCGIAVLCAFIAGALEPRE